ncbi:restriction endonuclease subunit S [Haemophilus parahaemolyticus]|uniref:restriction endonuclease subunit S n=1 Tax=Haemophilus parahaemolyticus TaxID=735 RepID=UPI0028EDAA32|nr:restriction endonuclease subunit S [Haemophilus parahaemolyticus]
MTEHKKLQPEIRFAGFTDDWEQRKLGDVVNVLDNLRIPIAASQRLEGVTPYYGANGIQGYIDGFTHDGEFVLVAEDGANDLINYPVQYVSGKVWINNHAHVLQGIKNVASNLFLVYRIKSMDMTKYLVGGGRTKLNASVMKDIELHLPNYAEQTQIGNFFKQLDDTIALHQRTLEKYQKLKVSYLEKMFPKGNERYPELRFPNSTDAWEQRKLGEFSKTTIGEFVIKTKQNPNSKYPVYNGGVSYTGFYDDFNNNGHKIIVSARGANAGFINIINGKYWAGNSCYSIDIQSDNYCIEYVYHFMKHKQHLFTDFQQAANIPSVSKKNVEEFLISYPRSKEEQTQIGNFFKQLDDTIALHQREVEKYKKIKQSYLEKMFI